MTVDPNDLALVDVNVAKLIWHHTSTQPDWPTRNFDPAAELSDEIRRTVGGDHRVARWAERRRARALHVGTYEAAIHNMMRRIDNQSDHGSQFYLYRVHLVFTVKVRGGWLIDPSDFAGDVDLDEVCPPGIDVARYLNYHEDPGALSLALGRTAIACTQRLAIPRTCSDSAWTSTAVLELERVAQSAPPSSGFRSTGSREAPSAKSIRARELAAPLAEQLPVNLRRQFESAARIEDTQDSAEWARYVVGLLDVLLMPERVLAELDRAAVGCH